MKTVTVRKNGTMYEVMKDNVVVYTTEKKRAYKPDGNYYIDIPEELRAQLDGKKSVRCGEVIEGWTKPEKNTTTSTKGSTSGWKNYLSEEEIERRRQADEEAKARAQEESKKVKELNSLKNSVAKFIELYGEDMAREVLMECLSIDLEFDVFDEELGELED